MKNKILLDGEYIADRRCATERRDKQPRSEYVRWTEVIGIITVLILVFGFLVKNTLDKQDREIEKQNTIIITLGERQNQADGNALRMEKSISALEECVAWLKKYTGLK